MNRPHHVAVLAGGPSCEREVSLVSGKAVCDALNRKGFHAFMVDPARGFIDELKAERTEFVFIALHGTFGEDGTVQRMLDNASIPYTGTDAVSSELAFDKTLAQALFKKNGILVPDHRIYRNSERAQVRAPVYFPAIVKPARSGSSMGITIVQDKDAYREACKLAFRFSDEIIVEEYIRGRELTVGILGDEALPVVEVVAQRTFYDYEAKYADTGTRYEVPAQLTPEESQRVRETALAVYKILGCRVMARVDLILTPDGRLFVLEANTIPGLTGKSLLPKAAKARGIEFDDLCVKIIEYSMLK